jgi:hypothetical protein
VLVIKDMIEDQKHQRRFDPNSFINHINTVAGWQTQPFGKVSSYAAMDAQLLYATPSHLVHHC